MRMTWDCSCNMSFIHLMSPTQYIIDEKYISISNYLQLDEAEIDIPLIEGYDLNGILNSMKLNRKTYKKAKRGLGGIGDEFENYVDESGYLRWIEIIIEREKLIELFKERVFRIYRTSWNSRNYYLLTLDSFESVFDHTNVIYPLTNKLDPFIIVKVKKYRFGFFRRFKIGYIKGLITTKNDIYPIDYLTKTQFVLYGY